MRLLRRSGWVFIFIAAFLVIEVTIYLIYRSHNQHRHEALKPFFDSETYAQCHPQVKSESIFDLEKAALTWKSNELCRGLYRKFRAIYRLSRVTSNITVKEPFLEKVKSWLPGFSEEDIQHQEVFSVFNRYTFEHSIINPTRSKRPGVSATEDTERYINHLVKESSKDCDFCQYMQKTAENSFGRIESKFSSTAANMFPFDGFHGIIILKNHHPLQFTLEEFIDVMSVARKWMKKAHEENPAYIYPHLTWDCLPKGSTSQVHAHAQIILNSVAHYGQMEQLKSAALNFEKDFAGESYFQTLFEIHKGLNLSVCLGDAKALTLLTPKKDDDMFVTASKPSEDFYRLLYHVLRAYIDDMKLYAWSMVLFFPALDSEGDWEPHSLPVIARLISRGPPTIMRSDISSLELFAASNVNTDPFVVVKHIRNSLKKAGLETQC